MRTRLAFLAILGLPLASAAQPAATVLSPPGPDAPAFDVASVKPGNPDPGRLFGFMPLPNGRLRVISVPVSLLIEQSYALRSFQMIGAPDWTRSTRVDIEARAPEGTSPVAMMAMMRRLLGDRFKLQAHVETREVDVHALVLARPGQPAALSRTVEDCDAILAAEAKRLADNPNARLQGPTTADGRRLCAGTVRSRVVDGVSMLEYASGGETMAASTWSREGAALPRSTRSTPCCDNSSPIDSGEVGRPVLDRTNLSGRFDFSVRYAPRYATALQTALPGGAPVPLSVDAPPIERAIQDLGFRLESRRGPMPVLVIDRIERPTAD